MIICNIQILEVPAHNTPSTPPSSSRVQILAHFASSLLSPVSTKWEQLEVPDSVIMWRPSDFRQRRGSYLSSTQMMCPLGSRWAAAVTQDQADTWISRGAWFAWWKNGSSWRAPIARWWRWPCFLRINSLQITRCSGKVFQNNWRMISWCTEQQNFLPL